MGCGLGIVQEGGNPVVEVDPPGPTNMNRIVHKARLAAGVGVINDVIKPLGLQLELDLLGRLVVHLHVQAGLLLPLGVDRGNHEDDVGIGLFQLV